MIERIVALAVAHRRLTLALVGVLTVIALGAAFNLELDALPDVTNNQVLVLTRAAGLTPEEVEVRVTRPIEAALGGLPGLELHRSISRYGISSITTVFADNVDPYRARQLVQERLNTVLEALPAGVETPELGPVTGGLGEIVHLTLRAENRTPAELFEIANLRISPLLRSVSGVVEVNTWGGAQRTIDVVADPLRLAERALTIEDLRNAVALAVGTAPAASVLAGTNQALLRVVSQPANPSELGLAVVRHGDTPIRLADVATLREGALTRIGSATRDGTGETVYLMAQMLRGANALEVVHAIDARMPDVRAVIPSDVQIDVVYDRSVLVEKTMRTVGKSLLEGGALVIVVLFLMLGSVRAGLLVASVIPLSMLGALAGMVVFGIPGNLMSLGAIDFGLVVDGAVVMVEFVFHAMHDDPQKRWDDRVSPLVTRVARPVFFSVLIILLVYVPILTLTGVDGKMFRPMALTVFFALVCSLVLALTYVPAGVAALLGPRDVPKRTPWLPRLLERYYGPLLDKATRHPRIVAVAAVLTLALGGVLYARAGTEFVPQLDEGDLVVQTTRSPDISIEGAIREASHFESVLRARIPEVTSVVSRIGSPAIATDIMGLDQADVFVGLKPRDDWRQGLTREALIAEIDAVLDRDAPGSGPGYTQPIQMRFNELLGGTVTDVAIAIYGDDLTTLRSLAEKTRDALAQVKGAADVRVLAPPDVALVEVRPRPLDVAALGYTVHDVLEAVQALRQGVEVGYTYIGVVRVPILLKLDWSPTVYDIAQLPLAHKGGGLVPLQRIADVTQTRSASLVGHQNGARRLLVGFNVRGADLGDVVESGHTAMAGITLPEGYRVEWGGQFEQLEAAARRLRVVIPLVVVLILALLYAAFRSVRPMLLIFTNVPFACVGGIAALTLRGMPVSISAAVGFIALSGVAVLNGVVLMTQILDEVRRGVPSAKAARDAALSRARPVLMTALVAGLGFVPMMLAQGVGAEVQRPLATVVVGGLITSTLLTLIVLPALYSWFDARADR